ncbi:MULTISPECIES: hypothetical protein [unclassified Herbaspirillum]|uniref:hypothetical protein n=1 Tax=unclassified Herbaspirillum TaxID=2624150 RepID=UPI000C0958AB|nr:MULTISPECIES: hypothetical protein [unclassified Herbaspirillum]MAF00885.1 hypothetical protein [Herbaspirillum sp.]MBO16627.1 hypothetical protein [Herbaspirillum sp.]|tara:strand:- start:3045 stop:3524 length:480 start_codon:yes stop_codon:yes gene_type:complete
MSAANDTPLNPQQQALLSSAAAVDDAVAPLVTVDEKGNPIEPAADQQNMQDSAFSRNRDLLQLGIGMLTPMLPFLPECYTPQVVDAIAAQFTAVEIKRGWNLGEKMTPEVMLAVVALPPTFQAFMLGREYLAIKRAEKTAQNAGNQEKPFGEVINEHSQ